MQTEAKKRTAEEIQELKLDWHGDPCWDIEDTEGFEAHHEELLQYRLEVERAGMERWRRELEEKAEQLGAPGNTALARYVERLEDSLEELRERVESLEARA